MFWENSLIWEQPCPSNGNPPDFIHPGSPPHFCVPLGDMSLMIFLALRLQRLILIFVHAFAEAP